MKIKFVANAFQAAVIICYLFLCTLNVEATQRVSVFSPPSVENSDDLQFFLLEAAFPYNTPDNIRMAAGYSFDRYGIAHAGLGVWDTTTDTKFSIEFLSNDYVGGLLPQLDADNVITWLNEASVVITNPMVEEDWLYSQLVSTTSGTAYNNLITYLQDNIDLYTTYQPVTPFYLNSSLINGTIQPQLYATNVIFSAGTVLVPNQDSFWFVSETLVQLNSYGCDVEAFLDILATAFAYTSATNEQPGVVEWISSEEPANQAVYDWYSELTACYKEVLDTTESTNGGITFFLSRVKRCYTVSPFAYFYRSDNSVYNVTLGNISDFLNTPLLVQYIYPLPPDNDDHFENMGFLDYFIVFLVVVAIIVLVLYCVRRSVGKTRRRRVSFEGERIAARTVDLIASDKYNGGHMDDAMRESQQTEKDYYMGDSIGSSHAASRTWNSFVTSLRASGMALSMTSDNDRSTKHTFDRSSVADKKYKEHKKVQKSKANSTAAGTNDQAALTGDRILLDELVSDNPTVADSTTRGGRPQNSSWFRKNPLTSYGPRRMTTEEYHEQLSDQQRQSEAARVGANPSFATQRPSYVHPVYNESSGTVAVPGHDPPASLSPLEDGRMQNTVVAPHSNSSNNNVSGDVNRSSASRSNSPRRDEKEPRSINL